MTRRSIEVDSLAEFDRHIADTTALNGWFVQSVDLSDRAAALNRVDPRGAVFLGCLLTPATEASLRARGALLFPSLPDLPFDPYRPRLYAAAELYGPRQSTPAPAHSSDPSRVPYASSADAAIYAWSLSTGHAHSLDHTLAAALHDHAITNALDDATHDDSPERVVGVMGGHSLGRDQSAYRAAAELGLTLTRNGLTVLTGGGPGAMEAANLGAYLSAHPDALDEALATLSRSPSYLPGVDDWVGAAFQVTSRWPEAAAGRSFSIPTWFYGHEPTNVFATHIAKFFTNALREDTLLHRCRGGIVYLPGQAGTVQEIFQAVTENFYAADSGLITPMILVGVDYWTVTYPAWPLLQRLGTGRPMSAAIRCVDTVAEAAAILLAHRRIR